MLDAQLTQSSLCLEKPIGLFLRELHYLEMFCGCCNLLADYEPNVIEKLFEK